MKIATLCILRDVHGLIEVSLTDDYEVKLEPLSGGRDNFKNRLLNAWQDLFQADFADSSTFGLVFLVLKNTFPYAANTASLPNLVEAAHEPQKPKATAANPRAFKGTKRQPPKQNAKKNIDLRPYLTNMQGIQQIILLSEDLQREFAKNSDPGQAEYLSLPDDFRISFYQLIREYSPSFIKKFLQIYFDLDLDNNNSLRKLSLKLLHKTNAADASHFLQTLLLLESTSRETVLKATLDISDDSNKFAKIGSRLSDTLLLALEFEKYSSIEAVWEHTLSGLRNDAQSELIRFDLELHRDFSKTLSKDDQFQTVYLKKTPRPLCRLDEIRSVLSHYAKTQKEPKRQSRFTYDQGVALAMFCAESNENEKTFLEIPWKKLNPEIANSFIYRIRFESISNSSMLEVASFLAKYGDSDISWSLLNEFSQFEFHKELELKNAPEFISWFLKIEILENACDAYLGEVFYRLFSGFQPELKARLLQIPDKNWKEVIKACLRSNDANLIYIALKNFQRVLPEFLMHSLEKAPRALMKTLKTMGCLNRHLSEQILKRFAQESIYKMQPSENVLEQRQILKAVIDNSCTIAINRKVRDAITRDLDLAPELLSRAFDEVILNMERIKLDHLEKMIFEAMSDRKISDMQNKVRHAFKILHQNNKEPHARAFKKFLNHFLDGDTNYLANHQLNQTWLKKNDSINFDPWLNGFQRRYHVGDDKTAYTLKIELDPLEELKHGTYVGTCTGIGGKFSWSALGTVLDINKRVVYAFDDQNQIYCRQIIAISKEKKLTLFAVYPDNTEKEVKRLFVQYSQDLAKLMGIEILEQDADYKIELILTSDWWDDFQYIEESEETDEESASTV
ncbi:MAG: hypothetical protein KIT34_01410 [Cyanobacteria bacterium TGS_CYA1]|nr:hypothetical protein [Cyanobacteria bacterium TGS_CYA1]